MKRIFDLVCSIFALIIFSPIFIIVSLLIVLDSSGSVFFRGVRIGQKGKPFRIFKFRSMIKDADCKGKWNVGDNDQRITRIGHFLRKSKLDELPQLLNVAIGEMSFVGPRPELEFYVNMYDEREKRILDLKPGITDWASITHFKQYANFTKSDDPDEEYLKNIRPLKLKLQLYYLENHSFLTDFRILKYTVLKVFFRSLKLPEDIQSVINDFKKSIEKRN